MMANLIWQLDVHFLKYRMSSPGNPRTGLTTSYQYVDTKGFGLLLMKVAGCPSELRQQSLRLEAEGRLVSIERTVWPKLHSHEGRGAAQIWDPHDTTTTDSTCGIVHENRKQDSEVHTSDAHTRFIYRPQVEHSAELTVQRHF